MLSITRAGLSASSKGQFNHGKHQREIIFTQIWCHGMQVCGVFGAALHPVAYHRGEGKALPLQGGRLQSHGATLGRPQRCTVS